MTELKPVVKRPTYRFELPTERKNVKIGRGFSKGELEKAGLTIQEAKKYKIPIDKRRKTIYEDNVSLLKKFVEEKKQQESNKGTQTSNTQSSNKS